MSTDNLNNAVISEVDIASSDLNVGETSSMQLTGEEKVHENNKNLEETLQHTESDISADSKHEHTNAENAETVEIGNKPKRKKANIIDSESEDEIFGPNQTESRSLESKIDKPKSGVIDSDGEIDEITPHNKSFNADIEAPVFTSDAKGNLMQENEISQATRLAMLCDSESDEDDSIINNIVHENHFKEKELQMKPSKKKKHSKKTEIENTKKMTRKEAAVMRKEIQSESQRMLREKDVYLPYHKPKMHSLKEFLARRSKLASALPLSKQTPASIAIKMSTQQLEIISKRLKEREKELKEFYKSDSESEDDCNDQDYIPSNDKKVNEAGKENTSDNDISEPNEEVLSESNMETDFDEIIVLNDNKINTACTNSDVNDKVADIETDCDENTPQVPTQELLDTAKQNEEHLEFGDTVNIQNNDLELHSNTEGTTSERTKNDSENNHHHRENCNDIQNENQSEEEIHSYDFSLDDIEENHEALTDHQTEKTTETNENENMIPNITHKTFIRTEIDEEIEQFGNNEKAAVKSKLDILKEKIGNIKPKLSGGPDQVIDLNLGVNTNNEVMQLMERFAKHVSAKKDHPKHKVHLSIVTVENDGDVHKETVAMNIDDESNIAVNEERPGAKLQRLRQELQIQMAQKKTEIWQQKASKGFNSINNEESKDEEGDCNDKILDDEEEEYEITDDEESEEELIEDDVCLKEDKMKKSAFIDGEAEESEMEDETDAQVIMDNEDSNDDNTEDIETNSNINETDEESNLELKEEPKNRTLKRILKAYEDSDEEDQEEETTLVQDKLETQPNIATQNEDEDLIPPHQQQPNKTPIRPNITQSTSGLDFLTPISFITSLQNLSTSKSVRNSPIISPFRMPEDSPLKSNLVSASQKKLFLDTDVLNSQAPNDPSTQNDTITNEILNLDPNNESNENPSTQDLLEICSGQFTGITQLEPTEEKCTETCETNNIDMTNCTEEIKMLDDDQDLIISQLLDEEELENFKKKFESPVNNVSQKTRLDSLDEESSQANEIVGGGIIDSDEEDDNIEIKSKRMKKKILFSDDESSEDEEQDEEIELQDHISDNEAIEDIAYDSEENEIDVNEIKKEKLKTADFFEDEAELSESDWGSEDEDEKNLDKMEFELGDTEKFDEEKVREDIERIHMRRLLDDDTREVKILQELLLEDGEMHGTGRQRQFRWKNLTEETDDNEERPKEDEVFLDEEESEEQWRKQRHEREMFLKEKKEKTLQLDCDLLSNSALLKNGQKILERSQSQTSSQNSIHGDDENCSPISKSFSLFMSKRGSFLSRGEQLLQRVAEYTKVTSNIGANSNKTTKNFIFQKVSHSEVVSLESKKRKMDEGTPNIIKKLRLTANLSPAFKKKSSNSKKLFNDI